jgi:hypothetical protein
VSRDGRLRFGEDVDPDVVPAAMMVKPAAVTPEVRLQIPSLHSFVERRLLALRSFALD